jgi:recombination protein RecA
LSGAIKQTNTAVIFTNQLRMKIGVMFGNPETTTGGRALKFYASVRLDMRRVESIKVGQEVVGNRVRVRVVKNKVASPFKVAEFDIMYDEGISKVGGILDLGVETELIEKRGSFYSYEDQRLGQGRENSKKYLRDNPELTSEIGRRIRANSGLDRTTENLDVEAEREENTAQEALPFEPSEEVILDTVET